MKCDSWMMAVMYYYYYLCSLEEIMLSDDDHLSVLSLVIFYFVFIYIISPRDELCNFEYF